MKIVEYKKHINDGNLFDPPWIKYGSGWPCKSTHTWIGVIEDTPPYYVPDTLVEMSVDEFKERCRLIHTVTPYCNYAGGTQLTNEQLEERMDMWLEEVGIN